MQRQSNSSIPAPGYAPSQDLGTADAVVQGKAKKKWMHRGAWTFVASAAVAAVLILAGHSPAFYNRRLAAMAPETQKELSERFLTRGTRLLSAILADTKWKETFDESSINAWLAEDFAQNHAHVLPAYVHEPRVAIENNLLRLGFRWRFGPLQTTVQVSLNVWVPKQNCLAVELFGASAGLIRLPTSHVRRVLEKIAETNGCDLTWKRHGDRLIALVRLPPGGRITLRRAEISGGSLYISGQSTRFSLQPESLSKVEK